MNATSFLLASVHLEGVSVRWAWVWLLLVLAGAGFLIWTYRGIYRRTGQRLAWWLLALRGVGLLLLVLMLAKPTWIRAREEVEPGRVALVVDTSRSMSLADESGVTRYERARAAADALRQAFAARTGDGRLAVDLFDVTGAPVKELPAEPTGDFTDLTRCLHRVQAQMRGRPTAGIILLSDGTDTTGRPGFADWEDAGVPVHTVGFPQAADFDLAVREPAAPRRVIVHNELFVEVPVAKKGTAPVDATVTLRRGRDVLASEKVALPAGDVERVVRLPYKPDQPGSFELTAAVASAAGERDTGNNAVNFPLEVAKDPIRVLYVEGFLRNEYTFLVRHFADNDPDVSLIREPRRTSPDGPDRQLRDGVLTERTLEKVDVVILGDMEGDYLSGPQVQALVRWLDGKNRSLLVLGGYESFGPKGFRTTPLADVLPVEFAATGAAQSDRPFTLLPTEKGITHPIFTLSADRPRTEKGWKEAPPLAGMPLVARAKPAADVLAVNPEAAVDGQPAIAVAAQRAPGGGQVLVVCPDTTWKWSRFLRILGQDDTLYSRFWSQAIRWLAGRGSDDTRPLLAVRTGKPVHEANGKVTVRVVRQRRPGTDLSTAQTRVDITDPKGQPIAGLTPRVDAADPDTATVEFYPSAAGRYEISAALTADGKTLANQTAEVRVRGADLELADAGTRPDHLRAIAEATGGVAVLVADAATLAERVTGGARRTERVQRSEYWDSPWLFAAFLAAVSGEWFLRRRQHLV